MRGNHSQIYIYIFLIIYTLLTQLDYINNLIGGGTTGTYISKGIKAMLACLPRPILHGFWKPDLY